MATRETTLLWRYLGLFVGILGLLIGGTWITVKATTDHLLYEHATNAARNWAQYLAANVPDLEQIAAGETPSSASMAFFNATRKSGEVFRYVIFNRYGYSILESRRDKVTPVELSDYSAPALLSVKENRPVVDARQGTSPEQPGYFAEAYVPVLVDGRPVAIVGAYVDQTVERDRFYRAFIVAALSLCGLTGFSFGLPAFAWYRRTREKQQADLRIHFLAHHDTLTGVLNRGRFAEALGNLLITLAPDRSFAIHFIDIDHFKAINDTFGHDGGDVVLRTIAERLTAMVRREDAVARLGGDEFVVVQADAATKEAAESFGRRILAEMARPMPFKDQEISITVSIGVALAPEDGRTTDRLLKSADLAVYKSKTDGRNCVRVFLPEMDAQLMARVKLEKSIREAVATGHFVLHYQPMYEILNRRLIGFEALVRMPADDGTLIPPMIFIPVAEEMRLIDKIGAWVLDEACRTAANWPAPLTVAVNMSPAQFASGRVSEIVAEALRGSGLDARRLEIEITESLLLADSNGAMNELTKLKAMGVAIVMDDFGTGYSSLSYLWRFPFDKIKIDRSFMLGLDRSGRDAETVVKTIVALGRELGMRVTVEGVEKASQATFLEGFDSDQAQGFFFGRPVPASEIKPELLAHLQPTAETRKAGA